VPLSINAEIDSSRIAHTNTIQNAEIYLELESFDASSTLGVFNIFINPNSQSINASGAVLNFASSSIEVIATLTGSSFCDFFLENTFDNNSAELRLSGMKPFPGVATTSLLGQVMFQKKGSATSTVFIINEQSMILANNGYATNILSTTTTSLEL
jgi:hypothetical protein